MCSVHVCGYVVWLWCVRGVVYVVRMCSVCGVRGVTVRCVYGVVYVVRMCVWCGYVVCMCECGRTRGVWCGCCVVWCTRCV